MKRIVYIVGAGLTKALERLPQRVPLMQDFVSVMADHIDDDVILTHLAEMENADLFEVPSLDAKTIASGLACGNDRSPMVRAKFKEILKSRPVENIEVLLEKSLKKGGGELIRFNFAINRIFCRIAWNLNLKPLLRFLDNQFRIQNAANT